MIRVVYARLEAPVASFRIPFFTVGHQPSYPAAPPATVYGLISGILGWFMPPERLQVGICFQALAERADDLEKIWVIEPGPRRVNLQAEPNILRREWLLQPVLELYIRTDDPEAIASAFRTPRFPPVFGRSQELASIRQVEVRELIWGLPERVDPGVYPRDLEALRFEARALYMPQWISPVERRTVWDWFQVLEYPFEPEQPEPGWIDPRAGRRLVAWIAF